MKRCFLLLAASLYAFAADAPLLSILDKFPATLDPNMPERTWLDPLKHSYIDLLELVTTPTATASLTMRSLGDGTTFLLPHEDFAKELSEGQVLLTRVIRDPKRSDSGHAIWAGCGLILSASEGKALYDKTRDWERRMEMSSGELVLGEWQEFTKRFGHVLLWMFAEMRVAALIDAVTHIGYRTPNGDPYLYAIALYDIDSAEGLENLVRLFLPIEEAFGARSTNYIVPCAWPLNHALINEVACRGHEIGVHGYDHANRTPFLPAQHRLQRLARGKEFGDCYCAVGYRAPSLLRTKELLADLAALYRYDSSIPTAGGPFPVANNGCASGRPWRIGKIWELPITLPRDGSLQFLGYSPDLIARLWQETAQILARSGAIVSLLTHCEAGFSGNARMLGAYRAFIEFVAASAQFEFVRPCDLIARIEATREPA